MITYLSSHATLHFMMKRNIALKQVLHNIHIYINALLGKQFIWIYLRKKR